MRLVLSLVVLLIIGLLVARNLQSPKSLPTETSVVGEVPSVPTRPQDVPQFEQNINSYINQAAEDQARQIDEATRP